MQLLFKLKTRALITTKKKTITINHHNSIPIRHNYTHMYKSKIKIKSRKINTLKLITYMSSKKKA